MRSKISFFNKGLFLSNLKRFLWAAILETIVMFFCFPMNLMTMYTDAMWLQDATDVLERYQEFPLLCNLTICVYAVALAVLLFSYLHKPKITTALHGLPVSRTTLFGSTLLSGVALLWLPIAVNVLAIFITKQTMEIGAWIVVASVMRWAVYAALLSLVLFALTTLVGMFVGNAAAQFVFTYILHFLPLALFAAFTALGQIFLYGFDSSVDMPQWMLELPMMTIAHDFIKPCGYYIFLFAVESIVLLALAWIVYKKRPLEQAGDVVVFDWVKPVFKYGLSLCAAIYGFLYVAGIGALETEGTIVINTVVAVLWTMVGFCIAQMLIAKTWRIFSAYKEMLLTCLVVAVVFVGLQSDIIGFEKRMVTPEQVAYVELEGFREYPHTEICLKEPENIRLVTELHKCAVEQGEDVEGYDYYAYVHINYHLKNGQTLKRAYSLPMTEQQLAIYNTQEAKMHGYPMLYAKLDAIETVRIDAGEVGGYIYDWSVLIEALRLDVENLDYTSVITSDQSWDDVKAEDVEHLWGKSFNLEIAIREDDGDVARGEARDYKRHYYLEIGEYTMPNAYAALAEMLVGLK